MKPSSTIDDIRLADIDLTDTRFKISTGDEDLSSLALSIRETGLLNPPIVWRENNFYIVVSGFKRIKAICSNGETNSIACRSLDSNPLDCAVRAVCENAFQRELTLAEQIRSVLLLNQFLGTDKIAEKSLSIFNTSLNEKYIKDLLIIGGKGSRMLDLINCGQLSLKPAIKISGYNNELMDISLDIFTHIKVSASKQLDIITCFREISARERLSPGKLYKDKEFEKIICHKTEDLGFKGNMLRQYLAQRRYPFLEKTRTRVKEKIKQLRLGNNIKLIPPENFEGTNHLVSFDFKDLGDFKQRVAALESILDNPILKEILEP